MKRVIHVFDSGIDLAEYQPAWRWTVSNHSGDLVGASHKAYLKRIRCLENLEQLTGYTYTDARIASKVGASFPKGELTWSLDDGRRDRR